MSRIRVSKVASIQEAKRRKDWPAVVYFWMIGLALVTYVVARIALDASTVLVYNEANALLSPSGTWLAGWGHAPEDPHPGVRLYQASGDLLQPVSGDSIQDLVWQPGSNGFFYLAFKSFKTPNMDVGYLHNPKPIERFGKVRKR